MQAPAGLSQVIAQLRSVGVSFHTIAAELNKCGLPGPQGGRWYGASVHRLLYGAARSGEHRCTERCRLQERPCRQAQTSLTPHQ